MTMTLTYTEPATLPAEETQLQELLSRARITKTAELQWMTKATAEIKTKLEAVKAERDSFVKPLKKVADGLAKKYKPALDSLTECEKIAKEKIADYATFLDGHKDHALALAEAAAQAGEVDKATALIQSASAYELPKVSGLSIRQAPHATIADSHALVSYCAANGLLHLLQPNVAAIEQAAKTDTLPKDLPGVSIGKKTTVAITKDRVEA